jgi:hypothetical protein
MWEQGAWAAHAWAEYAWLGMLEQPEFEWPPSFAYIVVPARVDCVEVTGRVERIFVGRRGNQYQ